MLPTPEELSRTLFEIWERYDKVGIDDDGFIDITMMKDGEIFEGPTGYDKEGAQGAITKDFSPSDAEDLAIELLDQLT